MRLVAPIILALAVSAAGAGAEEAESRFTLEKTPDGYVRMDNRTGEMSICSTRDGQLLCRLAADERDAWQDEIGRLTRRLEEVERRLGEIDKAAATPSLPSEDEFEKSLTLMERFMRRFMDIVKDLDAENAPAQKT
jgi:hypothetical protein